MRGKGNAWAFEKLGSCGRNRGGTTSWRCPKCGRVRLQFPSQRAVQGVALRTRVAWKREFRVPMRVSPSPRGRRGIDLLLVVRRSESAQSRPTAEPQHDVG